MKPAGLSATSRSQLSKLLRDSPPIVTPDQAAAALGLTTSAAARRLAAWSRSGWLARLRRGAYVPVPIESESADIALDDAWSVAATMFAPCYVGGWSAAEHWGLTEQLFRSTCVMTTTRPRDRRPVLRMAPFALHTIAPAQFFGLKTVWRGGTRVQVSDPARTVVDMLANPALAGGIRPAADVLKAFLRDHGKSAAMLLDYGDRLDNGAIFKRLGFLLESQGLDQASLVAECRKRLRSGYVKLDSSIPVPRLITAWGLWVPKRWAAERSHD